MDFKKWFLKESYSEDYLKSLVPQWEIGHGSFAVVYSTQDPDIVMRIEADQSDAERSKTKPEFRDMACEKFMARPEIQATGGVGKIYKIERRPYNFQDEKKPIAITYKERVDTDWLNKWKDKYGSDKVYALLAAFRSHDKDKVIDKLKEFSDTEGLIKAVALGLPLVDLSYYNLGLNKDGQLVVIDC